MVKCMLALSVSVNAILAGALFLSLGKSEKSYVAEAGTAYVVVSQNLKRIIGAQSGELQWSKVCPHVAGDSIAFNSTSGKIVSEAISQEIPLRVESAYRYDARLSVECSPFYLTCYRLDNLAVEQTKTLTPRL